MRKLFVILGLLSALILPRFVLAIDTGLSTTGNAAFGNNESSVSLPAFIGTYIIAPVSGIIGVLFFALTVYAGVLWMTAQGDSKKVEKARDILVAAVIGSVIVVASYALTDAVFNAITTGNV